MHVIIFIYRQLLFPVLIALILIGCSQADSPIYEQQTDKKFEETIHDVEFIIAEQNFRITNKLHIGDAIRERGAIDFPRNEVILFCNLTLAEEMLRLAPAYINYCPYKIAIAEVDGATVLSTWLLPEHTDNENLDAIAKNINKILRSMIEYAASEDPFLFEFNRE